MSSQRITRVLAAAGALPFVASALLHALTIDHLPYLGEIHRIATTYGLTIASFMAGVHWGIALKAMRPLPVPLFLTSNALTLAAWFAFLLGSTNLTLVVLALVFGLLLLVDARLRADELIDDHYWKTRVGITAIVILALLSMVLHDGPRTSSPGANTAPETEQADALLGATLPHIIAALDNDEISSTELVKRYLARIERIDRAGPTLQSVLSLNPDALTVAQKRDQQRAAGQLLGPLHGVPIMLKDNIESADPIATTAGALALADNITGRDSPLVRGLRDAGAIILGKTNLSQWANFRSNRSISGWSALGGQVRNPHVLNRSPCGSSSGSAVAVAASLVTAAVGTETNGSIICPANVNGIVGFKPTVGLISQQHIIPISSSQDTAGPLTKTVTGAAVLLTAMADGEARRDYVTALDSASLAGTRIGVARFAQGNNQDIIKTFDQALTALRDAGAELVEISTFAERDGTFWSGARKVLEFEFKTTLNDYLADAAPAVETRSLAALIAFNEANAERELALFDQSIFVAANALGEADLPAYLEARDYVQTFAGKDGIDALLRDHNLSALVSPSGPIASHIDPVNGDVWPSWAGAGWMAAVAGYPHLSVPMGDVHGVPVGLSFIGGKNDDAGVLALGYAYEQRTNKRVTPRYLTTTSERPEIGRAMHRP